MEGQHDGCDFWTHVDHSSQLYRIQEQSVQRLDICITTKLVNDVEWEWDPPYHTVHPDVCKT